MNRDPSRRTFVAVGAACLAAMANALGERLPTRCTDGVDARADDKLSRGATVTTYTCDKYRRLISTTTPADSTVTAFRYDDM